MKRQPRSPRGQSETLDAFGDRAFTIRNLADVLEIERIPLQQRLGVSTTFELLDNAATLSPESPALTFLGSGDAYEEPLSYSYGQLIGKIRQSANAFHSLGLGPSSVVSYLLPNIPQTHFTLWGAEAAAIVNPINPMLEPATIRDICRAANTEVLVALGELPGTDIWPKVLAIKDEIPSLKTVLCVNGSSATNDGAYDFDEFISTFPEDRLQFDRQACSDDIVSLYHTGGTTGTPKLARRTHSNEIFMAWAAKAMLGVGPTSTIVCGLPLFHVNGTTATGLMPFSVGAQVVLASPAGYRDPSVIKNFYKIVERYRATFFSAVPTVLSLLLEVPAAGADISSLDNAICGAAPLSVELFRRFEKHTGMKILEAYGLTEGAAASSINPKDGERKVGSIGLRLPYQEMKAVIVGDDGAYVRDAATNEIGTIAICGPNVFHGYVDEAHNRGIWLGDGWFNTGDLGRVDEDGFFWLTGRKKELIIRGGHNIDPATIEEALYQLPGVKVAAAVGRPDAHAGEVPVAFVELAQGSDISSAQLLEHAKKSIGERAAIPAETQVLEAMPLTPVGKIFKPALRWKVIEQAYSDALEELRNSGASVSVKAREDKAHGTKVEIDVSAAPGVDSDALVARVRELLARYTLKYEVRVVSEAPENGRASRV